MILLDGPKRRVAMFCMALCLVLSTQVTLALLDRIQHAFSIDHAPSALAGLVDLGHSGDHLDYGYGAGHSYLHASESPGSPHHHEHDQTEIGKNGLVSHHHSGPGILAPWLISVSAEFIHPPLETVRYQHKVSAHPNAPEWRRERPPKSDLESLV